MASLATSTVDRMRDLDGSCDFARDVAVNFPLSVINGILGLPESDFGRMLLLTQELFGSADPEMQRGHTMEDLQKVIMEFFVYFGELTAARRAHPTEDLASVIDEMIRWTTPVKHFMRTAQTDYVLRGKEIAAGDWLLLSYPSGNRDEAVFADPFAFDAGRTPNKHLAFGLGVHFCLGAMLARMEMKALFAELIPRLDGIALAGEPALMQTLFVGGHKRLPIQYTMRG
jgi:cytochrome P450